MKVYYKDQIHCRDESHQHVRGSRQSRIRVLFIILWTWILWVMATCFTSEIYSSGPNEVGLVSVCYPKVGQNDASKYGVV